MNLTRPIVQTPSVEAQISWIMFTWVLPAICFFGVITNIINIVILSSKDLKEDMYKYMLAYSVSDFLYSFFVSLTLFLIKKFEISQFDRFDSLIYPCLLDRSSFLGSREVNTRSLRHTWLNLMNSMFFS